MSEPELSHIGALSGKLSRIILQECIILHYALLDLIQRPRRMLGMSLVRSDLAGFQDGYELLAVSSDLSREVGPLDLRVKECLLRILLLFLERY